MGGVSEFEDVEKSLDDLAADTLIGEDDDEEPLHKQPRALARAFGRLLDVLANKGLVGKDELSHILEFHEDFTLEKE